MAAWARQLVKPVATAAALGVGVYALLSLRSGSVRAIDPAIAADISRAGVARSKGAPLNAIPPLQRALDELMKGGAHPDAVVQVALFLAAAQTEARRHDAALATLRRATAIADTLASKAAAGQGSTKQLSPCRELQILGGVQSTYLALEDAPAVAAAAASGEELVGRRAAHLAAGIAAAAARAERDGALQRLPGAPVGEGSISSSSGAASSLPPPPLSPSERRLLLDYAAMLHEGAVAAVAAVAPASAWPSGPPSPSSSPTADAPPGLDAALARAARWSNACAGALHVLLVDVERAGSKASQLGVGSSSAPLAGGAWAENGVADGVVPIAAFKKEVTRRLAEHGAVRAELAAALLAAGGSAS